MVALLAAVRAYLDQRAYRTKLLKMEEELRAAKQLMLQKTNLANEVAHELKNPLSAMLCSVESLDLLIGPRLDCDHRKTLSLIKEYGDHVSRLVQIRSANLVFVRIQ